MQLGVVELEGVHASPAHARAVAPVDVLILIHAIDIVLCIHGQRAVVDLLRYLLYVLLRRVLVERDALALI